MSPRAFVELCPALPYPHYARSREMSVKTEASFFVQAVWDEEAGVYISHSDIDGLHVEAATLDEFSRSSKISHPTCWLRITT